LDEDDSEIKIAQKPVNPFEEKINVLEDMGFPEKAKNIEALIQTKGDVTKAVQVLLSK